MNSLQDLPTLIFIVLTLFVIYRLRSILGNTNEDTPKKIMRSYPLGQSTNTPLTPQWDSSWLLYFEDGHDIQQKVSALLVRYPVFHPNDFLQGAKAAYELIITAYAQGDKTTLRQYVDKIVYDNFCQSIDQRNNAHQKLELKIIGEQNVKIKDIEMIDDDIHIIVYFHMSIVQILKDEKDEVINSPEQQNADTNDLWTFAKSIRDKDPNWRLIATQTRS
jgi:predicted lipid-binding transport protein (Tim44 family)